MTAVRCLRTVLVIILWRSSLLFLARYHVRSSEFVTYRKVWVVCSFTCYSSGRISTAKYSGWHFGTAKYSWGQWSTVDDVILGQRSTVEDSALNLKSEGKWKILLRRHTSGKKKTRLSNTAHTMVGINNLYSHTKHKSHTLHVPKRHRGNVLHDTIAPKGTSPVVRIIWIFWHQICNMISSKPNSVFAIDQGYYK